MREFKFRVWGKNKLTLVKSISYADDGCSKTVMVEPAPKTEYYNGMVHSENCTLQQYIGLLDKNGKEIFEGDIIQGYLSVDDLGSGGCVDSNEFEFIDKVIYQGCGFYCEKADFPIDQYETLEILGNIFENPELLK